MKRHPEPLSPAGAKASRQGLRVLLVESSPVGRQSLDRLVASTTGLTAVGYATALAPALGMILRHAPDLMVCNLHLPGANSLELARRAHLLRPGIRVIIISQVAGVVREASLAHGADGFALQSHLEEQLLAEIHRLFPDRLPTTVPRKDETTVGTDFSSHNLSSR